MKRSLRAVVLIVLAAGLIVSGAPTPTYAADDVGYVDFSFGSAPGEAPTADKPQSKLWFNDAVWWAVMFHIDSGTYHIYRLNWPETWVDTGTQADDRPLTHADTLWDGTHLYIASALSKNDGSVPSNSPARLYRYSYSDGVYTLDTGFPTVMMTGSIESITIDQDSTGQLWTTFTQSKKVYVTHSTVDDATWATPFVIPGPTSTTNVASDDISSLVAYRQSGHNAIGVLWSNHNDPSSMYFAYHKDGDPSGTWSTIEAIYAPETLPCAADDHINIKSLQSDSSGVLYAALKTSFGDSGCGGSSNSPLIRLVVRKPNNSWQIATFGTIADDHTRPLVLLDTSNRMVYMFATSRTSCGVIYMKSTSMDDLNFPSGKGTPFIRNNTYTCINNATSTKQTVNANTGLVVLASDTNGQVYLHNALALSGPPSDTTPPTVLARSPQANATNVAITSSVSATFSEALAPATVNTNSVQLIGPSATTVIATVTYDDNTHTLTLVPSTHLSFNTTYTIQLSSAITDLAGNTLVPVTWNFTTAPAPVTDTTPPTITTYAPVNGARNVAVASSVSATFSEAIDPATINPNTFQLTIGSQRITTSIVYSPATFTVVLHPTSPLIVNITYSATISGISDLVGNPMPMPVTWTFTTANAPAPQQLVFLPFAHR